MAPFPLLHQVVMSRTSQDNLNNLSDDFIQKFKQNDHEIIIEAFLQTDFRTSGNQSPRPFQLECAIALKTGQDLICTAGCSAGKILVMAKGILVEIVLDLRAKCGHKKLNWRNPEVL